MKKALITGISGQDGAYLAKILISKGYKVYGADRRSSERSSWRLAYLNIIDKVELIEFELSEYSQIASIIKTIQPDHFYNLAAMSFVGSSFNQPIYTHEVNSLGVCRILDAIHHFSRDTKFYQASTSEMFGRVQEIPQSETTPFYPRSPYGVSKLSAYWQTVNYMESYDIFASNGILFNHESPLRGNQFVTKKIVREAYDIHKGAEKTLKLGNLDAKRDWGFAGDYTIAMNLILESDMPDNYVVATGETRTVREFCEKTFAFFGKQIVWEGADEGECGFDKETGKKLIEVSKEFFRPAEVDVLVGDFSKINQNLGWEPSTNFYQLIEMMCSEEEETRRFTI